MKLKYSKNPNGACVPFLLANLLDRPGLIAQFPAKPPTDTAAGGYDAADITDMIRAAKVDGANRLRVVASRPGGLDISDLSQHLQHNENAALDCYSNDINITSFRFKYVAMLRTVSGGQHAVGLVTTPGSGGVELIDTKHTDSRATSWRKFIKHHNVMSLFIINSDANMPAFFEV